MYIHTRTYVSVREHTFARGSRNSFIHSTDTKNIGQFSVLKAIYLRFVGARVGRGQWFVAHVA